MLEFPSAPADGEYSKQPNGVVYRWDATKTRWSAAEAESSPAILGAVTLVAISDPAWVADARTVFIRFTLTGAGGGGGGIQSSNGEGSQSNGGTGGATAVKGTDVIDPSYNIVIGAGGAGGAAGSNNGSDGGASTLDSDTLDLDAPGGFFGAGRSSGTSQNRTGKVGPLATGGDFNFPGGDSHSGGVITARTTNSCASGGSYWGHGRNIPFTAAGLVGNAPGVGGSGNANADSATNRPGGAGADGICQIEEYFAAPSVI